MMMIMPSSASSSSAVVQVDKATSDLLIDPDWTLNIEICDSINSNHWQAKDVIKAVKKRLQHKSSTVQLLALTLLETMVKNCGEYVHFQIVDRNILQEMVKIVRKKTDATVRDKVLVLLDSWQEAFGGPGGKYPQYYWAYEELKQSGVQFPKRSEDAVPIFTPPAMHPPVRHTQPSYGMPSNASTRLDQAMSSETETVSMSSLDAMGRVAELLTDMLGAATPGDLEAVKDELIIDLVDQCRSNQKRLMQMLTSTGDEELLGRGLELNDNLQNVLAKHDAIASGLPLPVHHQIADTSSQTADAGSSSVQNLEKESEQASGLSSIVPVAPDTCRQVEDEDEDEDDEEDDFAQLARRHSKHQNSQTGNAVTLSTSTSTTAQASPSDEVGVTPLLSNALVLADPVPPVRTTKDQDMIDLLSLTLTTTSPHSPAPPAESSHQPPAPPAPLVHPNGFQATHNYVAPWSQSQPQPLPQTYPPSFQAQDTFHQQSFHHQNVQSEVPQPRLPSQQYAQNSPGYIPPPWAATPGYYNNQSPIVSNNAPQNYESSSNMATQQPNRPQQYNTSGSAVQKDTQTTSGHAAAQKPFIPSYRLFEDLDVFGNTDGRIKGSGDGGSPSLSGTSGHRMVGGNQ